MSKLADIFCKRKESLAGINFIDINKKMTNVRYSELYEDSIKLLASLKKSGIKEHDEVIVQIKSDREFITCFWACILGGIIIVPIPFCDKAELVGMLNHVIKKLNTPFIYVEKLYEEKFINVVKTVHEINVDNILHRIVKKMYIEQVEEKIIFKSKDNDIALIQFSSGSTGIPKGVSITYENIKNNCDSIFKALLVTGEDRILSWLPYTHNFALIGGHVAPLIKNIEQYKMPTEMFLVKPIEWLNYLSDFDITISFSPNFGFLRCMESLDKNSRYGWDFSHLRIIISGSEPVNDQCCQLFMKLLSSYGMSNTVVIPAYGMSETTLIISAGTPKEKYRKYILKRNKLNIGDEVELFDVVDDETIIFVEGGVAADGIDIRITDDLGNVLGTNRVGNIELFGKFVMQGYYNDQQNSKKAFTKDGWLKTGDIGALIEDRVVILGRKKDIIFLNGKNYYPNDFEECIYKNLNLLPGTIVIAGMFDESIQSEKIVLFISNLYQSGNVVNDIKKLIADNMHMVIEDVVFVTDFPRTSNGKIQRYKLVEMLRQGMLSKSECMIHDKGNIFFGALSENEELLLNILKNVTEDEDVNVNDNFITLGLNSIKAGKYIALINENYKLNLGIDKVFTYPTVKDLACYIASEKDNLLNVIKHVEKISKFPASAQQQRMFALHTLNPRSTNYNIFTGLMIDGAFDYLRAEKVFLEIINRHEILRTNFTMENGDIYQLIHDSIDFNIDYVKDCKNVDEYVNSYIRSFDLGEEPLIRVLIIELTRTSYIMVIDIHHIISDGSTMGIIIKEFCKLYNGERLEAPKYQYKDYANWQSEYVKSDLFLKEEKYWSQYLEGDLPLLELPVDFERQETQNFDGSRIEIFIGKDRTMKIQELSRKYGVTSYMILMSAYSILLSKYANQNEVLLGSTIVGRSLAEFMDVMGLFVNTVVFRNKPEPTKTYKELLDEIKTDTLNAYANQNYQFDWLIKKIKFKKEKNRNPIFDVMFNMQNMELPQINLSGLEISPFALQDDSTRFDLILIINELPDDIKFEFIYCNKLFADTTIYKLKDRFIRTLDIVLEEPKIKIGDINLLDVASVDLGEQKELDFTFSF